MLQAGKHGVCHKHQEGLLLLGQQVECTAQVGGTCKHWVAYSLETSEGFTRQSFNAVVSSRRAGRLLRFTCLRHQSSCTPCISLQGQDARDHALPQQG